MKTQKFIQTAAVTLAVFLTLALAAKFSVLVSQQPHHAAAAGPLPADSAIAISIPAATSSAVTNTVAGLYTKPDSSSKVVEWMMPGMTVRLLGRNTDGEYFAIAGGAKSEKVIGWIEAEDLIVEDTSTHMVAMAKVYRQPDKSEEVVNMLTYGQAIIVLGTTPDGKWSAVASKDGDHGLIGWVLTAELQTEPR